MVGIYEIQNVKNKKCYVGSSHNIKNRWRQHKFALRNNRHHSQHLQNSWNKHGEQNFKFNIIEECTSDILITREQYYLDKYKPKYNINKIAENCTGRVMSEESKKKISVKNKGRKHSAETKKKMSEYRKNNPIIFTEKTKQKISNSKKGVNNPNYGKKLSTAHIKSIKQANTGKVLNIETKKAIGRKNSKAIIQLDLKGNFIKTWNSTMDVERELGFFGSGITKVCRGGGLTYKGYKWCYKNKINMELIKKQIIYTNKDNEDFSLLENTNIKEASEWKNYLEVNIIRGNSSIYLLSPKEVDEFCELLQKRKKEIWKV